MKKILSIAMSAVLAASMMAGAVMADEAEDSFDMISGTNGLLGAAALAFDNPYGHA